MPNERVEKKKKHTHTRTHIHPFIHKINSRTTRKTSQICAWHLLPKGFRAELHVLLQVHDAPLQLRHLRQTLPHVAGARFQPLRDALRGFQLGGVLCGELGQIVGFGAAAHLEKKSRSKEGTTKGHMVVGEELFPTKTEHIRTHRITQTQG